MDAEAPPARRQRKVPASNASTVSAKARDGAGAARAGSTAAPGGSTPGRRVKSGVPTKFSTSESMRRAQAKYRAKLRDQRAAVFTQHETMSRELAVARAERAVLGVRADVLARTLCWQEDIIGALRRAFPEGAPRPLDAPPGEALPSLGASSAPFEALAVRAPKLAAVAAVASALSGGSLASSGPSVHYPALASELGRILDGPGAGQPGLLEAFLGGTLGPSAAAAPQDRWRPLSLPGVSPGQLAFLEGTAEFGAVIALGAAIRCGGPIVRCTASGRVQRRSDPLDTVIEAYDVAIEACPTPILPPRARAIYSCAPTGRWMQENDDEDWELELALSDIRPVDHAAEWGAHIASDTVGGSHDLAGAHSDADAGVAARPDDDAMSVPPVAALVPTLGTSPGRGLVPSPAAQHVPPYPVDLLHEPLPMPGDPAAAPAPFGGAHSSTHPAHRHDPRASPAGAPQAFASPVPTIPAVPGLLGASGDLAQSAALGPGCDLVGQAAFAHAMHPHASPLQIPGVSAHGPATVPCSAPIACGFGRSVSLQTLGHSAPPGIDLADSPPSGGHGLAQSLSSGTHTAAQSPPSTGTASFPHPSVPESAAVAVAPPPPSAPNVPGHPAPAAPGFSYGPLPPGTPSVPGAQLSAVPPAMYSPHPSQQLVQGVLSPHSTHHVPVQGAPPPAPFPGALLSHLPIQVAPPLRSPLLTDLPPPPPLHATLQPHVGPHPHPHLQPHPHPHPHPHPRPQAAPPLSHLHPVGSAPSLAEVAAAQAAAAASRAVAVSLSEVAGGVHGANSMPSFDSGVHDAPPVGSPPLLVGSPQSLGSADDDLLGHPAKPTWRSRHGPGISMSSIWAAMNAGPRIFGSNMSVAQALARWNELRSLAGVAFECLETAQTEEEVADAIGVLSELRTECTGVTVAAVRAKPEELLAALRANGARVSLSPAKHASEIRLSGAQARRLYAWSLRVRRTEEALALQRRDAIASLLDAAREENLGPVEVAEAISSAARSGRVGGEVHVDLLGGDGAVPMQPGACTTQAQAQAPVQAQARAQFSRTSSVASDGSAAGAPSAAPASSNVSSAAASSPTSSGGMPTESLAAPPASGEAEYVDAAQAAAELESRLDRMSLRESAQRSQAMLEAIATLEDNLDAFRSIHRMKHCAMFQVMSLTQKIRALTSGCEEIFDSPGVFEAFVEQYANRISNGLEPPLHDDELLEPLAGDASLGEVLREGVGGGAARGATRGGRGASRAVPAMRLTSPAGLVTAVDPGQLAKDAVDSRFPLRTDKDLARFTLPADKSLVARSTPWDPRYVEGSLGAFRDRLEREEDEAAFQDWILGRVSIQSIIAPRIAT